VTSHREICLSLDLPVTNFPAIPISSPRKGKCCSASSTLSPSPWWFNVLSVHRHVDDRLHDFSPGQPAFGHDACGAHLFTQPCNGLYISRILPCHALGGSNIVLGSCWEIEKVCRTANHSAFDRLAIPRTSVPARLCLCRCGWFLVNSPMTCVYRLDISSFEYSRV